MTPHISQTNGFNLEVNNLSSNTVMVGVRVQVGSQAIERAPSYLEVFGRSGQSVFVISENI